MTPTAAPEAVKEAVNKTVTKINQQVKSRGTRVKNALRNAELEVLKGKRSGKKYRKPNSKRRYTASAPGEPPARRTGALRLNWTGGVETQAGSGKGVVVTSYIESNTPYTEDNPTVYEPVSVQPEQNGGNSISVPVSVSVSPQFVIDGSGGKSEDDIMAIIRKNMKAMADELGGEIADRLEKVFSNMPTAKEA